VHTGRLSTIGTRRSRLLAAVLGLFLLGLAGPATAASQHVIAGRADAILAATADVAVTARALPERLSPVHRTSLERDLPSGAALPAAVLVAFLLAVHVGRRRPVLAATQTRLLTAAGRGPPRTS
jgi:hypothetical protein